MVMMSTRVPAALIMKAGDVLFFNGQELVHGSQPNQTDTRFRRSLIGHYIGGEAQEVAKFYTRPCAWTGATTRWGWPAKAARSCGIWVDEMGQPVIEMTAAEGSGGRHE